MKQKRLKKTRWAVILFVIVLLSVAGCGKDSDVELTTAKAEDAESMIEAYVQAYRNVDYRRMWGYWPQEVFGGKVNILADMKKDIFQNYYSKKASLEVEYGEITAGTQEDQERVLNYFSIADVRYVTDLYRTEYRATVAGGKRAGDIYKEGIIFAFRNNGKWYVYDD